MKKKTAIQLAKPGSELYTAIFIMWLYIKSNNDLVKKRRAQKYINELARRKKRNAQALWIAIEHEAGIRCYDFVDHILY